MYRHGAAVQGARGFGLLEAIVALAILSSTGLALFAWIQQSTQTAARVQAREQEAQLLLAAHALMEPVNPSAQREGQLELGSIQVRWRAELVEPARQNVSFAGTSPGPWTLGLYRVSVEASDRGSGAKQHFEQLKVGTTRLYVRGQGL